MRFVDEASVYVKSGDGGRGCVSFRREKFVPKGGPDGGDGGKGGDVIILGKKGLISLLDFKYKRSYKAEKGQLGGGKNKRGRNGEDLFIPVPLGTVVFDEATREQLADIVEDGQMFVAARGGLGGRGNARFVTPVRRAPRLFDDGQKGEERNLRLELKLLADIGIMGLPNVGKSTLLSRLTQARPEIADYPFTTLTPSLGVFADDDHTLVLADIPGIIHGAAAGKGLGLTFLRHIERTRTLLWVLDASSSSLAKDYQTLSTELGLYRKEMLQRPRIIVLNKADLVARASLTRKEAALRKKGEHVVTVSALTGAGMDRLRETIWEGRDLRAHG